MSTTPKIPSVDDWKRNPAVANAGTKGFNPLIEIPKALQKEFSWMREFEFAFMAESDLPIAGAAGWIHLRKDMFDPENFNTAIGLRFGIMERGGILKLMDNYIMIMPRDENKRVISERNEAFEREYERNSFGAGIYTDDNDPKARKMREDLIDKGLDDIGLKEEKFSIEPPKKRGRPPKNK